jgi:hypothetical protein
MNAKKTILIGLSLLALGAGAASAAGRWIHLRVDEGHGGARVSINLPLALVQRVAEMAPRDAHRSSRLRFDDVELTPAELRALWRSLDEGENVRIVDIRRGGRHAAAWEDRDESVYAWRHGGYLHLRVRDASDRGARRAGRATESAPRIDWGRRERPFAPSRPWDREDVHVKMPAAVVEALLSGDEDELDVAAAIRALARHGEGELVTVSGDDETVRIWIDGTPEPGR